MACFHRKYNFEKSICSGGTAIDFLLKNLYENKIHCYRVSSRSSSLNHNLYS
jgi:hypothetical protein